MRDSGAVREPGQLGSGVLAFKGLLDDLQNPERSMRPVSRLSGLMWMPGAWSISVRPPAMSSHLTVVLESSNLRVKLRRAPFIFITVKIICVGRLKFGPFAMYMRKIPSVCMAIYINKMQSFGKDTIVQLDFRG